MTRELTTINPATEQVINTYEIMTKEQINEKAKKAQESFREWKKDMHKRDDHIHDFAQELRKNKEELARTMTKEMGKAIKEARSEVEKCAWVMDYFADNGKVFTTDEVVNTDARKSIVTFEPLGVIGSIMPWNFPYWQALRFAAPSMMAGNTIVLKPASATMGCGIEIEKAFSKSGAPDGVFQTLVGDSSIADIIIDSENVSIYSKGIRLGEIKMHSVLAAIYRPTVGNLNEKVAPLSSLFSPHILPPCASIMLLQIYNPKPVPFSDPVVNFVNNLGSISATMPEPVSFTETITEPSSILFSLVIVTTPFLVKLKALLIRLERTWLILPLSTYTSITS